MTLNISILLYYVYNINNNNHKNDLNITKLTDRLPNVEHAWDSSGQKGEVTCKRGVTLKILLVVESDTEYAEAFNTNR